jgi:hypothetical protein
LNVSIAKERFDSHSTFVVQSRMVIGHTSLHESHQTRILFPCSFEESIDQLLIAPTSIRQCAFIEHSIQQLLFMSRECPLIPFFVFHHFYFLTIISILSIPFIPTRRLRDFLWLCFLLHSFALFDTFFQQINLMLVFRCSQVLFGLAEMNSHRIGHLLTQGSIVSEDDAGQKLFLFQGQNEFHDQR